MADIVVLGAITQDLTLAVAAMPEADGSVRAEKCREVVGGKGANPAIACARLGAQVAVLGAVGDDEVGKRMRKQLAAHDVDVALIQVAPGAITERIVHLVEPDGRRRYIESGGANNRITIDTAKLRKVLRTDSWLLISTALPADPLLTAAEVAREVGAKVALDLAGPPETSQPLLRYADLVRGDADETEALTATEICDFETAATAARWLQVRGPNTVVVEARADGDLLRSHTTETPIPRRPVTTVDPTGAGDAFIATLIVRLAAGDDPPRAAALASAAAGHTASQLGGTPRFGLSDLEPLV